MRRRDFIALAPAAAIFPRTSVAQQRAKIRLAILDASFPVDVQREGGNPRYDAFLAELRRLGLREGDNLVVLRRSGVGVSEAGWAALVGDALAWSPDIVFASPSRMALQLKAQTTTVPIVFVGGNPVGGGVVSNVVRPGGNITGFSQDAGEEIYDKWEQLLLAAVPSAARFGILVRNDWWAGPYGDSYRTRPRPVGVPLVPLLVDGALDDASLGRAFETLPREPVSALIIAAISEFIPFAPVIAQLALAARLPAISGQSLMTDAGLLMSYGPSYPDIFRRAATYVSDIVSGAEPGLLPIEQPTKFDLLVNLKTAKALGLTLPGEILTFATDFIQ